MDNSIRQKIQTLLDQHRTMRIATVRADGWPQVTTVGYANEGFTIYFLCGIDSQKAQNLSRDDRLSLAIDEDPMPNPSEVRLIGLTPTVISLLDYAKGFGHTDLVVCWGSWLQDS